MVRTLQYIPGVIQLHKIHFWSISPQEHCFMCHVKFSSKYPKDEFFRKANFIMDKNDVKFFTFQIEEDQKYE